MPNEPFREPEHVSTYRTGPPPVPGAAEPKVRSLATVAFAPAPAPEPRPLPAGANVWRAEELLDLGYNARAIKRMLATSVLVRVRYGCYVRGKFWENLKKPVRSRILVFTHNYGTLTTSPGRMVYTHSSAARLHHLFLWDVDERIHLTQRTKPSSDAHGSDVACHTRPLPATDVITIEGILTTTLERTAVDCGLSLSYRQALIVMDHALRKGADKHKMVLMAKGLTGHRGVRNLRLVLENADARSESPGETLSRDLFRKLCIPVPVSQFAVTSRAGKHRLDFAWQEKRVAMEFDGKIKYFDYKPTDEAIFEERRREKALMEDGWRFVRVEWKDLFLERQFKARILAALAT